MFRSLRRAGWERGGGVVLSEAVDRTSGPAQAGGRGVDVALPCPGVTNGHIVGAVRPAGPANLSTYQPGWYWSNSGPPSLALAPAWRSR